ncbi:MAG: RNase P subunit p30 family protein [Candidatus Bathyarchaeia archaeon]
MKRYVDLHVKPRSEEDVHDILETALKLGYKAIGLVIDSIHSQLVEEYNGLKILKRIDVDAKLDDLRKYRVRLSRKYDIVSAICRDSSDIRRALKCGFNIICFKGLPSTPKITDFSLIKYSEAYLELDLCDLLSFNEDERIMVFRSIARIFRYASRKDAKLILASGAVDSYKLRAPLDLASMVLPAGVTWFEALTAAVYNPSIFFSYMIRKSMGYVSEGVRIVRRW